MIINGRRMEFAFYFDGDRVIFPGLDWGYGDSAPYLISKTEHYLVMRVAGCGNWQELGRTGYTPAQWILLSYYKDGDKFRSLTELEREEPGRKWRAARDKLLKRMAELEKHHGKD